MRQQRQNRNFEQTLHFDSSCLQVHHRLRKILSQPLQGSLVEWERPWGSGTSICLKIRLRSSSIPPPSLGPSSGNLLSHNFSFQKRGGQLLLGRQPLHLSWMPPIQELSSSVFSWLTPLSSPNNDSQSTVQIKTQSNKLTRHPVLTL